MSIGNLLSGLFQGYEQGLAQEKERFTKEELKKLQIKQFKRDLELKDQQEAAMKDLMALFAPAMPAQTDDLGIGSTGAPAPAKSLKDVFGSPQGQGLALRAGYKLDDIRQVQQPGIAELIASLQTGNAVGGAIGQPPTGGFELSGIKLGPNGQPMLDLSRKGEVVRWMTDETGRFEVGVDRMGREVTRRAAPPNARAEEDKPVPPAQLSNFRNDKGEMPPAGSTMREIKAGGYRTTEDQKVNVSDAGRIAMLEQGIKDIDVATGIIFPNGELDKTVLFEMKAPFGGIGKGREVWTLVRNAIAGKLRVETGTAAPATEVDDIAKRFLPSPQDLTNEGLAQRKMERLREFMTGALDITTLPTHIREGIKKRTAENKQKTGKPEDPLGIR